jgi:hypothetical protein
MLAHWWWPLLKPKVTRKTQSITHIILRAIESKTCVLLFAYRLDSQPYRGRGGVRVFADNVCSSTVAGSGLIMNTTYPIIDQNGNGWYVEVTNFTTTGYYFKAVAECAP